MNTPSIQPDLSKNKFKEEIFSFAKMLLTLIVIAMLLRGTVIEAFKIPSGSMIPTLRIGDHILVAKFRYGFRLPFITETLYQYDTPEHGDVVVFTRPDDYSTNENESDINIIKRVIGLPGDIIEVKNATLIRNGAIVEEPYAQWDEGGSPMGEYGPVAVPMDHVLLLGDNRDHSKDSRFWPSPFLPMKLIKGQAFFIYWSWDSLKRLGTVIH